MFGRSAILRLLFRIPSLKITTRSGGNMPNITRPTPVAASMADSAFRGGKKVNIYDQVQVGYAANEPGAPNWLQTSA
jgi:hypothetical protein